MTFERRTDLTDADLRKAVKLRKRGWKWHKIEKEIGKATWQTIKANAEHAGLLKPKVKKLTGDEGYRECLVCERKFFSKSRANRVCPDCREINSKIADPYNVYGEINI